MNQPSKYQQAVYDFISNGKGNAVVDAKAGSGKTTTIVEAAKLIPVGNKCVFLAFNKAIAVELEKRLPKHVVAKTLNSLGYGAWMNHCSKKSVLDADKTKKLVRALQTELEKQYQQTSAEAHLEKFMLASNNYMALMGLVTKAKVAGLTPAGATGVLGLVADTDQAWIDLADHYNIELPTNVTGIIALARLILLRSVRDIATIDFDDQFYMSLIYSVRFTQYDFIFVDEAQDVSDIQREILKRSLKSTGRLIAVGDPNQSIYGFRGSNPESLNLIKADFQAITLPLSICYRCDKAIIALAQETVPTIEASATAAEGEVKDLGFIDQKFDYSVFTQTDMVICRYNAPLISLAYRLIAKKIACKVKGRDIAAGLITLIDKLKCSSVERLVVKLNEWLATETRRALAKNPDANLDSIQDKYDSLSTVIANSPFKTVDALKNEIDAMFSDSANGVLTLSSVHKAKGLESDRVFILNFSSMPSARATKAWEIQQEQNLIYVAVTRAKHVLLFISDPPKEKEPKGA